MAAYIVQIGDSVFQLSATLCISAYITKQWNYAAPSRSGPCGKPVTWKIFKKKLENYTVLSP